MFKSNVIRFAILISVTVSGFGQTLPKGDLRTPQCGVWYNVQGGGRVMSSCPSGQTSVEPQFATRPASNGGWRTFGQAARNIAAPVAPYVAPLRDGLRTVDHVERAASAIEQVGGNRYNDEPAEPRLRTRSEQPTQVAQNRNRGKGATALDPDHLQRENQRLSNPNLPTIAVARAVPMEEMNGHFGGYRNYTPFYMPGGFNTPAWGTNDPAGALNNYVQQQLVMQYRNDGRWNVLVPGTGHQSQTLQAMDAELGIGRGITNENGERTDRRDWLTARYSAVSSVGIIEENVRNLHIDGGRIGRTIEQLGIKKSRWLTDILRETVGTYQHGQTDRVIVGILHLVVVDNTTRTIVGSYEGIAAISYQEWSATTMSGVGVQNTKFPGPWKFARSLVQSALLTPVDQDAANERHINEREGRRDR